MYDNKNYQDVLLSGTYLSNAHRIHSVVSAFESWQSIRFIEVALIVVHRLVVVALTEMHRLMTEVILTLAHPLMTEVTLTLVHRLMTEVTLTLVHQKLLS